MAYRLVANLKDGAYLVIALTPEMIKNPNKACEVSHTILMPDGRDGGFHVLRKSLNELIAIVEKSGYKWFIDEYNEATEAWCERKRYANGLFR